MPTTTTQRRTTTAHHSSVRANGYRQYGGYQQARSEAARVYDYPMSYPSRTAPVRPRPQQPGRTQTGQKQAKPAQSAKAKQLGRAKLLKAFLRIAVVVGMCMLMLYRYTVILETSDRIAKLEAECNAIEASNQAMQTKIDRGLELGVLEEYATGKLGMVRPDSSQVFYIDMQMGDAAQEQQGEEKRGAEPVLQGTPGALVHAIQVLK